MLELAKCDLSYDVRDRACFLEKLVSSYLNSEGIKAEAGAASVPKNDELSRIIAKSIFGGQTKPGLPEAKNHRIYLPGSLSQIVLHAAPGYEPLPKPCSLTFDGIETNASGDQSTSGSSVTDDLGSVSGSLDEETASQYSSQHSSSGSSGSRGSDEADSMSENDDGNDPLIQLSESGNDHAPRTHDSLSGSADFGELMSKSALDSWLDEQPSLLPLNTSEPSPIHRSSARISMGDISGKIKRKRYGLLDPVNGNGLKVDYSFSSEISSISPLLVCLEASFRNCSMEPISSITLADEESSRVVDTPEQASTVTER